MAFAFRELTECGETFCTGTCSLGLPVTLRYSFPPHVGHLALAEVTVTTLFPWKSFMPEPVVFSFYTIVELIGQTIPCHSRHNPHIDVEATCTGVGYPLGVVPSLRRYNLFRWESTIARGERKPEFLLSAEVI